MRTLAGPFDTSRVHHRFILQPDWKAADLGVVAFVIDERPATLQALARAVWP